MTRERIVIRIVMKHQRRASPLHRGDATRNSTGNACIAPKKPTVKLSRTASDTRRGQEVEMPLRAQSRMQQARPFVRPIVTKKDHQRHHLQQQQQLQQHQNNSVTIPLRPLSDIMQKGIPGDKEVYMYIYNTHARTKVYRKELYSRVAKSSGKR